MAVILGVFFTACGIASVFASHLLAAHPLAGVSPLAAHYISDAARTSFETGVLFLLSAAALFGYAWSPRMRTLCASLAIKLRIAMYALPVRVRLILLFLACGVGIFLLNAPGVIHGYFLLDDFTMLDANSAHTLGQLLIMPGGRGGSHLMPLYRLEIAAFYQLFGTNPLPYNLFLLLLATTLVFLTYLLLRALGFDGISFLIFAAIFGGSVILSRSLAGFYNVTMYTRVLVLFIGSLWTYVLWSSAQPSAKRRLLLCISLLSVAAATFVDISGIWVPGAYLLFLVFYEIFIRNQPLRISVRKSLPIILGVAAIGVLMVLYGWYAYVQGFDGFAPTNHPSSVWSTGKSIYDVLTSGIFADLWFPNAGFIIDQPRFIALVPVWWGLMSFLFVLFLFLVYALLRWGSRSVRCYTVYFLLLTVGTAFLTAWARPSNRPAASFLFQDIFMPFYFFSLVLSIAAAEYMRQAQGAVYRRRALYVIAACISVFGAQHVFSLYNSENVREAEKSEAGVHLLQTTLSPALNALAANSSEMVNVPDLRGSYIYPTYSPDASIYQQAFLDLSPKIRFLSTRDGPYLASTSPAFLSALSTDAAIRSLYLRPVTVEMTFNAKLTDSMSPIRFQSDGSYRLAVSPATILPSKKHTLVLDVAIPVHPEKVYIQIGFNERYHQLDPKGTIQIDQFSKPIPGQADRYSVVVDLDQLYAYALSSNVRDLTLTFITPGMYELYAVGVQ